MIDDLIESLKQANEKNAGVVLLQALERMSDSYQQFDAVARNMFKLKRYLEAVPPAEKCLAHAITNEEMYTARANLVNVLAHAYEPERALLEIQILENINPNDADVRLKKAYALFLMGDRDDAEKILREELLNPIHDEKTINEIEFNLGTYEMYKDNFHEGLRRFLIHGRHMDLWNKPQLPFTTFTGNPVPGHMIVLRTEAGIGDEIINVRFMKEFEALGMIPVWYTDRKDMRDLFNRNGFKSVSSVDEIKPIWNGKDIFWCHSMDVPYLLKIEYPDLWNGPYLTASDDIKSPVVQRNKLKIGIRWQGNPDYDNDLHRSVPLSQLYDVVKTIDAEIYSLQRDYGVEDVYDFPEIVPLHETTLNTFEELLAVIRDLDVVITTCTSIAHAALAMGKQTFVFTPMSSYYVWCNTYGNKSPWYGDNLMLLRQKRPRYWDEPLAELKTNLHELLSDYTAKNS